MPSNSHWASSAPASRKRPSLPAAGGTPKLHTARGNAMSEFTIRSESVDVDQIMKQIRQRILEKRGADYTEDQIRELASVRLEKFLEPRNLRSDLLEQFRKSRPAVTTEPPTIEAPYAFDDQTLFASHRAPLRFMRKLLMPILKLFFNPNVLN